MMLLTAFVAAAETAPEPDYTTGTPWLYVDLIGNVTEETEANLKDNFALAANKEKLLKLEIPTGYPCIGIGEERVLQTQKDLARMFTKGTATSREARLAFNLYALLKAYKIDIAIVEGGVQDASINSIMLDTDFLVCAVSNESELAKIPKENVRRVAAENIEAIKSSNRRDFRF